MNNFNAQVTAFQATFSMLLNELNTPHSVSDSYVTHFDSLLANHHSQHPTILLVALQSAIEHYRDESLNKKEASVELKRLKLDALMLVYDIFVKDADRQVNYYTILAQCRNVIIANTHQDVLNAIAQLTRQPTRSDTFSITLEEFNKLTKVTPNVGEKSLKLVFGRNAEQDLLMEINGVQNITQI